MNALQIVSLKSFKLWQKFLLLGVIAMPAALVPFYLGYAEQQAAVDVAQTEVRGLDPSRTLLKIINALQRHRGLSANVLGGNKTLVAARSTTEAEVSQDLSEMNEQMKGIDDESTVDAWSEAKRATVALMLAVSNQTIEVGASNDEHTRILGDYLVLLDKTVDFYKLSLDPESHTYFLIQASLVHLPALGESFGQMRAYGTAILRAGAQTTTAADRDRMAGLIREGRGNYEKADSFLRKTFRAAPRLATRENVGDLKTLGEVSKRGLDIVRKEILDAGTYTLDAAVYLKAMTDVIEAQFKFTITSIDLLRAELDKKASDLRRRLALVTGVMLVLIAIALVLGYAIIRSVLRPVSHLQGVMEGLRQGDTALRARMDNTDEIGELGRQFDVMVDEREAVAAKKAAENEALNDSIIEILRSVSKLSQGDLRVHAPVREDVTGALSDAINSMTDSTAKALAGVNASSEAVRAESKIGRETVLSTAKGMNEVRGTIQETGKRIKRLGERSQEISGIVKLIDDIAERTSVLALNANMQAAVAGEAGRGFRVVADEVQRLAERSKEATDQIGKLVFTIQGETNDAIATMEKAISEVVKGGELAEKAAAQVSNLEKLGNELHASVQTFTLPEEAHAVAAAARRAA